MNRREVVCEDLSLAIDDLKRRGFRLDVIYPADEPQAAVLSSAEETVRLLVPAAPPLPDALPPFAPGFLLTRAGSGTGQGRAGMVYRDLIPGRLGGRYIASHISITEPGPVADWVHFHRIRFQMICVRKGWVRVVYEDQGEPFVMNAGDLVLQPPEIRHRVLENSAGLEVVEVGCPAVHETVADHDLELPNGVDRERRWSGQHFLHHIAADTGWTPFGAGQAQETAIGEATAGLAEVRTIRRAGSPELAFPAHGGELVFGFVLDGSALFARDGGLPLAAADAFVIPPGEQWRLTQCSDDFRLLHVTTSVTTGDRG